MCSVRYSQVVFFPFGEAAVSSFRGIFDVLSCSYEDILIRRLGGRANIVVYMFGLEGRTINNVREYVKGGRIGS